MPHTEEAEAASPVTVDPRSDKVVLVYTGENDRSARNAPPRDLTENDLARLAFVEHIREVAGDVGQPLDKDDPDSPLIERPDPRSPDPERVGAIVAELLASGRFRKTTKRERAAKDKDEDQGDSPDPSTTTDQPDAPATTPEG